jgi:sugar fermentation stimulation protein A
MKLPPLITGRLIRRYKRFLADVELDSSGIVTAHCANPGSMMGLNAPGIPVWLSVSDDPKRKLRHSWKLAEVDFGWCGPQLVSIDTGHPNALAEEAVLAGTIEALAGYATVRREVRYGRNSRIDLLLSGKNGPDGPLPDCYVEVKNVHLMHLEELGDMVEAGHRAVMLFVVQMAAERFAIASDLDPAYGAALKRAMARGVEVIVHVCTMATDRIALAGAIPFGDDGASVRPAADSGTGVRK